MVNCEGLSNALGGFFLFSSVYWVPWLVCWGLAVRKSPPTHLFNLAILFLVLFNICENAFEGYYFLTYRPDSLLYFYQIISAVRTAWNLAYLFPIVRGYLITYQPQDLKTSKELCYALAVALLYSLLLALINLLYNWSHSAQMWLSALTQLFLITLQLYYAAKTLEHEELALLDLPPRAQCLTGMRLRKLRAVVMVLLARFMKWIYNILAMMDISSVYEMCGGMSIDLLDVAIDLVINSFAIWQVWPGKKEGEEGIRLLVV